MRQRNWKGMCGTAGLVLLAACNNDPASQQAPDTARTVANDVVEDLGTTNHPAPENVAVPPDNAVGATGGHPAHQRPEPAPQPRSKPAPKPDGKAKPVEHPPGHDMNKM